MPALLIMTGMLDPRQPFRHSFLARFSERWEGVFRRLGEWFQQQLDESGLYPQIIDPWAVFAGCLADLQAIEAELDEIAAVTDPAEPEDSPLTAAALQVAGELHVLGRQMTEVLEDHPDPRRRPDPPPEADA